MARRRRHRKNPVGEDMVIGLLGLGMGALIAYFYVTKLPAALPTTTSS
jgi:hypothetical protein